MNCVWIQRSQLCISQSNKRVIAEGIRQACYVTTEEWQSDSTKTDAEQPTGSSQFLYFVHTIIAETMRTVVSNFGKTEGNLRTFQPIWVRTTMIMVHGKILERNFGGISASSIWLWYTGIEFLPKKNSCGLWDDDSLKNIQQKGYSSVLKFFQKKSLADCGIWTHACEHTSA